MKSLDLSDLSLKKKISILFLCADILEEPDCSYERWKEFYLLRGYDMTNFDLDEMQAHYIRTFLINSTKFKCVPYASWWLDGRMCGNSLYQINKFYEKCGYRFDVENINKPSDHVSFMIRFVAILAEEKQFDQIKEFSKFLKWLNDFADSLKIATEVKDFQIAVKISLDIINSLKDRECKIV